MATYRMVTRWHVPAPRDRVWEALSAADTYPQWWPGFDDAVLVDAGEPDGTGRRVRVRARSRLPYRLQYELVGRLVRRPDVIVVDSTGDLVGTGRMELHEHAGATTATLDWQVSTSRRFMQLLGPLVRPGFVWNHNQLMRRGAAGLARHLGCPPVVNETIEPTPRLSDWVPLAAAVVAVGVVITALVRRLPVADHAGRHVRGRLRG